MAYVYAYLVEKGLRTLGTVPIYIRGQVELILKQKEQLEAEVESKENINKKNNKEENKVIDLEPKQSEDKANADPVKDENVEGKENKGK